MKDMAAPSSGSATGGTVGDLPPNPKSQQKLSKKSGMELVGYTFRLKHYIQIPPPLFWDISELAPPLVLTIILSLIIVI